MNDTSKSANSIVAQEIDTKWFIIHWRQWHWKTSLAVFLAVESWPKRIYSNISIFKDWEPIGKYIKEVKEINDIRFSYEPWVVIIDEAGINYSWRRALSQENAIFSEFLFLVRKKNCSLIFISQRFESIDINARALAEVIFECKKIRRGKKHPLFKITRQKYKRGKLDFMSAYIVDTISLLKFDKIEYDQLQSSKVI